MQAPPKKKETREAQKHRQSGEFVIDKTKKQRCRNLLNIIDEVMYSLKSKKRKNSNFSGVENRIAPGYRRCSHGRPFVNQVIK